MNTQLPIKPEAFIADFATEGFVCLRDENRVGLEAPTRTHKLMLSRRTEATSLPYGSFRAVSGLMERP